MPAQRIAIVNRTMRGFAFGLPLYPSGTLTLTARAASLTFSTVNPCARSHAMSESSTESRKITSAGVDPEGRLTPGAGLVPIGPAGIAAVAAGRFAVAAGVLPDDFVPASGAGVVLPALPPGVAPGELPAVLLALGTAPAAAAGSLDVIAGAPVLSAAALSSDAALPEARQPAANIAAAATTAAGRRIITACPA
jgi:hypothetical protein